MDPQLDFAPDFGRYSSAIKRLWWLIASIAVAAGLVVAVGYSSTGNVMNARFYLTKLDQPITTDFGVVQPQLTIDEQVSELRSPETKTRILESSPAAEDVELTFNVLAGTISLAIEASESDAETVATAYDSELQAIRRRAAEKAIAALVDVGERNIQTLSEQLAQLDAATNGDAGPTVATTAAAIERAELTRQQAEAEQSLEALRALPDVAAAGVRQTPLTDGNASTAPRVVLAAMGAALLGAFAVAVIAFFDRRVRRSSDVERLIGRGAMIGQLGRGDSGSQLAALAAALKYMVPKGGLVQLIGVGGYDPSTLVESLNATHRFSDDVELSAVPGVDQDARAVELAPQAATNVFVVGTGRASETSLSDAAFVVRRAGGQVGGVVLVDGLA
jgi:hypothetical protein